MGNKLYYVIKACTCLLSGRCLGAYKTSIPKTRAPENCEPPNPTKIRLHVELDENDDLTIRLNQADVEDELECHMLTAVFLSTAVAENFHLLTMR